MIVEDNQQKTAYGDRTFKFDDVVKMKVAYPKEYTGKKHLKEGETIEVHVLQAEDFEKRGIAKIIK